MLEKNVTDLLVQYEDTATELRAIKNRLGRLEAHLLRDQTTMLWAIPSQGLYTIYIVYI